MLALTLVVAGPGVTTLGGSAAWAQGDKGQAPGTLAQAADKWDQAMLTEAAPLYEQALKEGGMFPSDVVIAYARIGTVQALMKQRDAALSSFRVAAVIDPAFELPSESGKLARELYERSRKDAASQGGKLEIAMEPLPEKLDAGQTFTVVAKVADAFAPVVDKIGIEVKDTLAKNVAWKSEQPSTSRVTFDVPAKVVKGATTLLVRVSALDQSGNRWAMQEGRIKVREAKPEPAEAPPPIDDKDKKDKDKSFFSTPWPYAIGGALLLGGVVAFFATRSPSEVTVGAPTWK